MWKMWHGLTGKIHIHTKRGIFNLGSSLTLRSQTIGGWNYTKFKLGGPLFNTQAHALIIPEPCISLFCSF